MRWGTWPPGGAFGPIYVDPLFLRELALVLVLVLVLVLDCYWIWYWYWCWCWWHC